MKMTFLWLVACSSKPTAPDVPAPSEPAPAPAPAPDPQALYESCVDRVEPPQQPGECESDADCQKTGCSSEMCVATSHGELMTTCEVEPCFAVLQTCGCHDGQCTWSVAAP